MRTGAILGSGNTVYLSVQRLHEAKPGNLQAFHFIFMQQNYLFLIRQWISQVMWMVHKSCGSHLIRNKYKHSQDSCSMAHSWWLSKCFLSLPGEATLWYKQSCYRYQRKAYTACGWQERPQRRAGTCAEQDEGTQDQEVGMNQECSDQRGGSVTQCPDVGLQPHLGVVTCTALLSIKRRVGIQFYITRYPSVIFKKRSHNFLS